jgi:hypothetical protein
MTQNATFNVELVGGPLCGNVATLSLNQLIEKQFRIRWTWGYGDGSDHHYILVYRVDYAEDGQLHPIAHYVKQFDTTT